MLVWRICKAKHQRTAFSGAGAAAWPGRWNSAGVRAVYCSESRALAAFEILANTEETSDLAAVRFVTISLEIPEALIYIPPRLPADWRRTPCTAVTQSFGDRFIEEKASPAMRVPSVIVSGEFNYVINPLHKSFAQLKQGEPMPFGFDPRVAAPRKPRA